MKKILLALAIFQLSTFNFQLSAQNDPVILEVGGQQIRQSEFMRDYRQSVGDNAIKAGLSQAEKSKAVSRMIAQRHRRFLFRMLIPRPPSSL